MTRHAPVTPSRRAAVGNATAGGHGDRTAARASASPRRTVRPAGHAARPEARHRLRAEPAHRARSSVACSCCSPAREDYYRLAAPGLAAAAGHRRAAPHPGAARSPTRSRPTVNGARRWIQLGPFDFQPSELARLAVVVWCAMLAAKKGDAGARVQEGHAPVHRGHRAALLSHPARAQPLDGHAGRAAGRRSCSSPRAPRSGISSCWAGAVLLVVSHQIRDAQYRLPALRDVPQSGRRDHRGRLPDQSVADRRRVRAASSASASGRASRSSGYLPYAYSDFLFSTIGEEWGFVGVWPWSRSSRSSAGWASASRAPRADPFGQYLAVGLTCADRSHRVPAHGGVTWADADHRTHAAVHVVRPLEPGHLARRAPAS